MSTAVNLRAWQARLTRHVASTDRPDVLAVACPASGKTLGAIAAAAEAMRRHDCDQLIVVGPTVVVRDQWLARLADVGYRMHAPGPRTGRGWPDWLHGTCTTYHQLAQRPDEYADAVRRRRTLVILDEVHHVGQQRAWGDAIATAFDAAVMRVHLSGTPFRTDRDAIPFLDYDTDGQCVADLHYGYRQAVRDGVCRPVEFRAHDGTVAWLHDGEQHEAALTDTIDAGMQARRLRASLDPRQPFLRDMIAAADRDLQAMRAHVPDAAGLIVCDSQEHAQAVDRLVAQVTGSLPVLACSDIPHAHAAIEAFGTETDPWLVSVRMVTEGVDIPRLGVVVWATAARTELMFRQVVGRALRGRGTAAPAVVHMPADNTLVDHAQRIATPGGVAINGRARPCDTRPSRQTRPAGRRDDRIDPAPLVQWFDRHAQAAGSGEPVCRRLGWTYDAGMRRIHRWRTGEWPTLWTVADLCHVADLDFDDLFAGEQYATARARLAAEGLEEQPPATSSAVHASHSGRAPEHITAGATVTVKAPRSAKATLTPPELPPSPAELEQQARERETARADVYRLLGVYTQLKRAADPAFQMASAHAELHAAVGPLNADDDTRTARALTWINEQTAALARQNPAAVKQLARTRRRLSLAA